MANGSRKGRNGERRNYERESVIDMFSDDARDARETREYATLNLATRHVSVNTIEDRAVALWYAGVMTRAGVPTVVVPVEVRDAQARGMVN